MMNVTLLVKSLESGRVEASVLELPAYRVEAETQELALSTLKTTLLEKVEGAEAFDWKIPVTKNPAWMKFAGIFKDNADFAEMVEEIQSTRDAWGEEAIDESEYLR